MIFVTVFVMPVMVCHILETLQFPNSHEFLPRKDERRAFVLCKPKYIYNCGPDHRSSWTGQLGQRHLMHTPPLYVRVRARVITPINAQSPRRHKEWTTAQRAGYTMLASLNCSWQSKECLCWGWLDLNSRRQESDLIGPHFRLRQLR
jgi:hypothetical protein